LGSLLRHPDLVPVQLQQLDLLPVFSPHRMRPEEQVQIEVPHPYGHVLLPGDEGEVGAQLHEESLHLPEDGRLQVPLTAGILQPQEVQEVDLATVQTVPGLS